MGILLNTSKFLRKHLFVFHRMLTNFSEKISYGQALKKQPPEAKGLSHIFPFMPGSPREVTLQSICLYDGYLKWLPMSSDGFCLVIMVKLSLFKYHFPDLHATPWTTGILKAFRGNKLLHGLCLGSGPQFTGNSQFR